MSIQARVIKIADEHEALKAGKRQPSDEAVLEICAVAADPATSTKATVVLVMLATQEAEQVAKAEYPAAAAPALTMFAQTPRDDYDRLVSCCLSLQAVAQAHGSRGCAMAWLAASQLFNIAGQEVGRAG